MSEAPSDFQGCLLILEILRDGYDGTNATPDERAILQEAHSIVQEYRDDLSEKNTQ